MKYISPRLAFDRQDDLEKLVVGAEYIKLIWVPDTFFVNEKIVLFHQVKLRIVDRIRGHLCHVLFLKPSLRFHTFF